VVDDGPTLVDAALAGLGVTQLFDYMAEPLLREGRLVQVLASEVAAGPDVHAVCSPGRRPRARRIRRLCRRVRGRVNPGATRDRRAGMIGSVAYGRPHFVFISLLIDAHSVSVSALL
jgi:hypothetical protein